MDRKRELTSVDLAALVGEFGAYEGAKVDKAYLYDDDLLRLKMRDFDRGRVELIIDLGDTKHVRIADPENVPDAPGRPPNFAMMLRNRLSGADFAGVEQYGFDRILQFHFDREDQSTTIVAELFGDGNVAVLDETGEVVDCLETVRLKSRTVVPGSQYEFPSERFDPLTADYEAFAARMADSDTDIVRTIATQLDFGGFWGEELCTRAGVEKTKDIADATEDDYQQLFHTLEDLRERLAGADLDSRVYYAGGDDSSDGESDDGPAEGESETGARGESETTAEGESETASETAGDGSAAETGPETWGPQIDVTPLPVEEYVDNPSEAFDTFTAALDEYFTDFEVELEESGAETGGGGGRDRPDFEEEIEKKERIIEQQRGAIENFEEQAEAERAKAELLYARYDLVDEIISTVQAARADDVPWDDIEARFEEGKERGIPEAEAVQGVDGSEGTVTIQIDDHRITLDASMGVEKNADHLYTEAKRIEEKKEGAEAAIENTREELEAVERRREEWDEEDEEPGAAAADESDDEDEEVDWLSKPSIPIRQGDMWFERFRWFRTSDGFLVIGGRNADQNEELVKKYLGKGDRFLHAQAHGGPATILKATGPSEPSKEVDFPDSTLQQAAQFAVSYSSVWKDGKFAGDVYMVDRDQVSKTPESGEFLEKGGFAIRGDRTYFDDVEVGVAIGIVCDPETRVIGGPPAAIQPRAVTSIELEPGQYAQNDMAKMCYRELKDRFTDDSFVRKVASPDRIQEFLALGGSRMVDE